MALNHQVLMKVDTENGVDITACEAGSLSSRAGCIQGRLLCRSMGRACTSTRRRR